MACVCLTLQVKKGKFITLALLVLIFVKSNLISVGVIGL